MIEHRFVGTTAECDDQCNHTVSYDVHIGFLCSCGATGKGSCFGPKDWINNAGLELWERHLKKIGVEPSEETLAYANATVERWMHLQHLNEDQFWREWRANPKAVKDRR